MNNVATMIDAPYRHPPHNLEAEQALLGAVLVNNEAFYRVGDALAPEHFHEAVHGEIFRVAGQLIRAGKVASPVTLRTFLPADYKVAQLSLPQYLARLAAEATTVINAPDYGRLIRDLAGRRALIGIGEELVNTAYDAPVEMTLGSLVEQAESALYVVAERERYDGGFERFSAGLTAAVDMMARAYQRDGSLTGLATGLSDLDRLMGGLQPTDLIIVAGRPGMGKTSLATGIAYSIARAYRGEVGSDGHTQTVNGGIVGFFSLEMSREQLSTRILSEQTEIPSSRMRRGDIEPAEFDRICQVAREIETIPLYIDETGAISLAQLAARARRLKRQRGLDLIVVDYIQIMAGAAAQTRGRQAENRTQEVTAITGGLKALAKELGVPVLALSQMSRQVESRDDKRPQLSDLRESGSIEQDADVVMFVFREEYYLRNKEPRAGSDAHIEWQAKMADCHGKADVIIGKQRHGPTGTITLQFRPEVTRFSDLADGGRLPERR